MKFFLLPMLFLSLPAMSTTLEECRKYSNEFLTKNTIDVDNDESHPYRLSSAAAMEGFDVQKLGIKLNKERSDKWRASCVNKPDMNHEFCPYPFPALNFMKATISGIQTGGWDDKAKTLAIGKVRDFLKHLTNEGYSLLDMLVAMTVLEDARVKGILSPDKAQLAKLRKESEDTAQAMRKYTISKSPDCKEAERAFEREDKAVASIRPRLVKILNKAL